MSANFQPMELDAMTAGYARHTSRVGLRRTQRVQAWFYRVADGLRRHPAPGRVDAQFGAGPGALQWCYEVDLNYTMQLNQRMATGRTWLL